MDGKVIESIYSTLYLLKLIYTHEQDNIKEEGKQNWQKVRDASIRLELKKNKTKKLVVNSLNSDFDYLVCARRGRIWLVFLSKNQHVRWGSLKTTKIKKKTKE
jgi:hypothetical protein